MGSVGRHQTRSPEGFRMKKSTNTGYEAIPYTGCTHHPALAGWQPLIRREPPFIGIAGVTLIELMAVLAVAVILVSIAVPAIGDFIRNGRMITQTNQFVGDIAFARSEAIKRAANVVICKSSNPTASPPSCNAAGDDWSSGWIIFVDDQTINNALDVGEDIVRFHEALPDGLTLFAAAGVANRVTYTRDGRSDLTAVSSFVLCDQRGTTRGRSITLAVTGRPTIDRNPSGCNPA